MNRGSALKWAELIETTPEKIDTRGCFKTSDGGFDYIGILIDFVNNGMWNDTGLGFYTTPDGHCAVIPDNVVKKCKIKTSLDAIVTVSDANFESDPGVYFTIDTDHPESRKIVANYIRENYEVL